MKTPLQDNNAQRLRNTTVEEHLLKKILLIKIITTILIVSLIITIANWMGQCYALYINNGLILRKYLRNRCYCFHFINEEI